MKIMSSLLKCLQTLFILLYNLLSFGDSSQLKVDEIQTGKNLEKAIETSVEDFFTKRIFNKIKKINVGNWEILYQDNQFVYFGYPKLKNIFSDTRIIDVLYKVNKIVLTKEFPGYKTITGITVKTQFYSTVFDFEKKINSKLLDITQQGNYLALLKPQSIEIFVKYTLNYGQLKKQYEYKLLFSKTTGKLMQIEINK